MAKPDLPTEEQQIEIWVRYLQVRWRRKPEALSLRNYIPHDERGAKYEQYVHVAGVADPYVPEECDSFFDPDGDRQARFHSLGMRHTFKMLPKQAV